MVLSTYDRETFGKTRYEDGFQEGRIESKQEIAKNMKAMGLDENTIAKATGLNKKKYKLCLCIRMGSSCFFQR